MLNVFVLTIIVACIIYIIVSISEVNNFHMINTQEDAVTTQTDPHTVRNLLKKKPPTAVRLYIEDEGGELTFLWQGLSSQLTGKYSSTVYPYIDYGAYRVIRELPESTDTNLQLVVRVN